MGNFIFGLLLGALSGFVLTFVGMDEAQIEFQDRLVRDGLGRYDTRITGSYRQFKWKD
jgi:hypothetical protein